MKQRQLSRRNLDDIKHVGIDEKSFGKGHDYVSVMTDLDQGRVLEVVPDRTLQSTNKLWETLTDLQKLNVKAVAMDMWKAFMSATQSA
jgi:transposase